MANITEKLAALPMVSRVSAWNDRIYVNLADYDSGSHGDRTRKIWLKGDVLTIERGKGCISPKFAASFADFLEALATVGATTQKPFGECISTATYMFAV